MVGQEVLVEDAKAPIEPIKPAQFKGVEIDGKMVSDKAEYTLKRDSILSKVENMEAKPLTVSELNDYQEVISAEQCVLTEQELSPKIRQNWRIFKTAPKADLLLTVY